MACQQIVTTLTSANFVQTTAIKRDTRVLIALIMMAVLTAIVKKDWAEKGFIFGF